MPRESLLPGVADDTCPPPVRCDARGEIRRAQQRALLREALHLALISTVDILFLTWSQARFPGLDRAQSADILLLCNVLLLAHLWLVRAAPRWSAERMSATWSRRERTRHTRTR